MNSLFCAISNAYAGSSDFVSGGAPAAAQEYTAATLSHSILSNGKE